MKTGLEDLIPDTIDGLLRRLETEGSENYRLTLLHKNRNNIYCFLSGNMQEITQETEIHTGMTIAFSKRTNIRVYYDVTFHKRETEDGYYFGFRTNTPFDKKQKIIPFLYTENPPSVIVDKNLKERLNAYVDETATYTLKSIEQIGKQGLVRAILSSEISKEWKNRKKSQKQLKESLESTVQSLFHEENSPSLFMQPNQYEWGDRKEETLFVRKINWPKTVFLGIPAMALVPYSALQSCHNKLQVKYKKKFSPNEEENPKVLLSDFAVAHPLAVKGVINGLESIKHASNMTMYAGGIISTILAYHYVDNWLSYPLITLNCLSGLTITSNLIRSQGRDSSALFSTLIDRKFFDHLD